MQEENSASFHGEKQARIMILVFMLAIILPLSTSFWIVNLVLFSTDSETYEPISPTRWLMSFTMPVLMVSWGLRKKSLDYTGAVAGLFVGFLITLSSYCFVSSMLCCFFITSKATRFRSHRKQKFEEDFKDGGQRNWVQVLCNVGVATEMALIYMMERGCGEGVIDFAVDYRGSWLAMAVLGAVSCASGDTLASELGTVVGTTMPRLITTGEQVPRGTNGAVSMAGLLFSALGGFLTSVAYYGALLVCVHKELLTDAPAQWHVVIVGTIAGLLGSVVDSLLGATLQFSGFNEKTGRVVDQPGEDVRHICGLQVLDNHGVNLLANLITALVTPVIATSMLF